MKSVNPADVIEGQTFSYFDVFGTKDARGFGTEHNGISYLIYDRYCMNPSCKCNNVIIQFLEDDDNAKRKAMFTALVYFKNKKYKIMDMTGISKTQADAVMKESMKDSDDAIELFKNRYQKMKTAGKAVLQEGKDTDVQTQTKHQRNAPCPCGSGKKYKKCCGA